MTKRTVTVEVETGDKDSIYLGQEIARDAKNGVTVVLTGSAILFERRPEDGPREQHIISLNDLAKAVFSEA